MRRNWRRQKETIKGVMGGGKWGEGRRETISNNEESPDTDSDIGFGKNSSSGCNNDNGISNKNNDHNNDNNDNNSGKSNNKACKDDDDNNY